MTTVCQQNQCTGCMACIDICPKNAITISDSLSAYNAIINKDICIGCNACHKICQNNQSPSLLPPVVWYEGWSQNKEVRAASSSGGVATAIALTFIEKGGVVCSCLFEKGEFVFQIAQTQEEVRAFRGSKYVKSNPQNAYTLVRSKLKENRKVLFIGLPCQVAALKIAIPQALQEHLYTIDLICHGSPSPQLLEYFLLQKKISLKNIKHVSFRGKKLYTLKTDHISFAPQSTMDHYSIAFLQGLSYTQNCYSCQYAQENRPGDITLGDNWGTSLPLEEQKKGVSLVLVQTAKGKALLENCALELSPANRSDAIAKNHNLLHPTILPPKRKHFFSLIEKGKSVDYAVKKCLPIPCLKQKLKALLHKIK